MAVQKSRKTRSRGGHRRSHDHANVEAMSFDKTTGQLHIRHNMTKDGFYKGKLVLIKTNKPVRKASQEEAQT